ncbi:KELCH REPEAT DOMAIN [Ceraceosorus bombacis]|uniref:KELCH REPEAT DOMAIN n=1 Tax=Ceraceosorus bombacis TaxID=401625 RepID=A0A0N7LBA0_9BASI|nr:KELCH REPEAT DOMAIN [Ceraceosorus bombacis]
MDDQQRAGPSRLQATLPASDTILAVDAAARASHRSTKRRRRRWTSYSARRLMSYGIAFAACSSFAAQTRAQTVQPVDTTASASATSGTDATATTMQTSSSAGRWGQASALLGSRLVIHGGKTQGSSPGGGGYTYNSAPNSADLMLLDLSKSWSGSSAPWQVLNSTAAPAVSFHSLLPLDADASRLLIFGGDATGSVPVQTNNDSAYTVTLAGSGSASTASWQAVGSSLDQPMRRIYHAAESDAKGSVWIVGGERNDGSGVVLDETWSMDSTASSPHFEQVTPPTGSIVDGTATLLSDGTLLMLGGTDASGTLQPFSSVSSFSTQSKAWTSFNTTGANSTTNGTPVARRGHVAVSLPEKRVFIHGGASADLATAYSDAWLLDWSVTPPRWSEVTGVGAPSARFGHSAVAYGCQVVICYGWQGNSAADTAVYVFDAIKAQVTSGGEWSGGSWTSSYTPDPAVASNGSKGSGSGSNGSSSNSGSQAPNGGNNGGTGTGGSFGNPTNTSKPQDDNGGGTSAGAKAGAVIAAFIGVGLVAGAGYAIYRRRQNDPSNWRHGDGAAELLGGGAGYRASDPYDDPYMMEKGGAGDGFYQVADRPGGPRAMGAPGGAWTAGNVGHAQEGSGPHFRERLAMLAGLGGFGAGAGAAQPRFNMLADEDELEHGDAYPMNDRNGLADRDDQTHRASAVDDVDDVELFYPSRPLREASYGRLDQDDIDEDISMGDIGGHGGRGSNPMDFVTSPFEDNAEAAARYGVAGLGAGILAYRAADDRPLESESGHSEATTGPSGIAGGVSSQSHTDHSTTGDSSLGQSAGEHALVSFSDAGRDHQSGPSRRSSRNVASPGGPRSAPAAGMKRSATWWDRFMGQSFLERSASGRLLPGPSADRPIRDPAAPPDLSTIRESPRSANPSEENPFGDANASIPNASVGHDADDLGRYVAGANAYTMGGGAHGRSLSSLQSARTATSSHFEAQLARMDVVQRTRTGSSRHTTSSSGASSNGMESLAPSREASTRRANVGRGSVDEVVTSPTGWTPGDWASAGAAQGIPTTVQEDDSSDGFDLHMPSTDAAGAAPFHNGLASADPGQPRDEFATPAGLTERSRSNIGENVRAARQRPSDAPSFTPSTTRRARDNPVLTSPLLPSSRHEPEPPTSGSVKDRVKAIERKATLDEALPIPRSPGALSASPAHSSESPSSSRTNHSPRRGHASLSPVSPRKDEGKSRPGYSHGLAPKAQLFVANPDRQGSTGSSIVNEPEL